MRSGLAVVLSPALSGQTSTTLHRHLLAAADSQSDNQFGVAVRCNVTKELDVTVGYAWVDGDGAFSISAGYNF